MQNIFLFLVQVVWFQFDYQDFLRNQTSCNSTNKQVCKPRTEVSFEIDFLITLHIFAQGVFITKALDILREKKTIF